MKPKATLRYFLGFASSAALAISSSHAITLTWDAGGGGGAITNGAGAWLGAGLWNNGGAAATWTSGDDAVFAGPATAGGAVTLASPTVVNSLTFSPSFTGTYTLGAAAQTLTLNTGITKNSGSGAVTIISPITLGGAQTWTNNSATTLQVNTPGVTNGGHQLTIDGTGTTSFGVINNVAVTLSGSGNLVKTGSGRFSFGGNNTGFSGNVTLNGGVTIVNGVGSIGSGNLTLNGGVYEEYWTNTFTRTLGAGAGQVQITGGTSGFGLNGATGMTVRLNNSATFEAVWGSASFNPSTFVLQAASAQNGSALTFDNKMDLNGADRTIAQNATTTATATIAQTIRNSSGTTAAGIIKIGPGNLILAATNTYDGNTAVNEGTLTANTSGALPGFATAGKVTVAAGATLAVRTAGWTAANIDSLRGAATWSATTSSLGFDTGGGSFTYGSNITEALSVTKLGTNTLTLAGNNSYTGNTRILTGTLQAGSATALGTGGDIIFGGGTLQYSAASAGSNYGSRIKNSTSAMLLDTNGQNVALSNIANTNTGGLTKSGAGTLTLNGTNSYTGTTTVNAGSIVVDGGTISSSPVNLAVAGASMSIINGGTVNSTGAASNFSASNTTMTVTGGNGVTSTWNLGNQQLGSANSALNNLQLVIDGAGYAGSAIVTNVSILVWGRTATNSTILLTNGGQMNVNGETRIGNPYYSETGGANLTIQGGTATSTFTGNAAQDFYIGYGERTGSKNNVVTVGAGGVLTNIRDMVVGHVNQTQNNDNPTTNNQLLVSGGTASMRQLSLGFADADTRDATANVLAVTSGGQLSTTGVSYIGRADNPTSTSNANTATVSGTGSSWNAGNQTLYVGHTNNASAQSNNNTLTVGAGGSLTNVNSLIVGFGLGTETGNQLVVNGSLSVNTLTVSTANTLSGSGTIGGAVTVNGTLSPGQSPGTLTFLNSLALGGSTIMEIDGMAGAGLTGGHDLVNLTGTGAAGALTYGGALTLDLGAIFVVGSYSWDLFNFASETGTLTGITLADQYSGSFTNDGFGVWSASTNANNEAWTFTESTGVLGLTVVPEPRAALLGGIGLLLLFRRRR